MAQVDLAVVIPDRPRYLLFGVKCYFTKNLLGCEEIPLFALYSPRRGRRGNYLPAPKVMVESLPNLRYSRNSLSFRADNLGL